MIEKASPFQDFVIPALVRETYGELLHFSPGMRVFALERFSCTEEDTWKASPFQVFVTPALEQETYGKFLPWGPGLEVFTLERFSYTEEDSRVSISQNVNSDRSIGPRRTTKVSEEVWASSLGIKQEEPTYSLTEKQMISADDDETPNSSVPALEASDKTKKMSKGCVSTTEASVKDKNKSKGDQKKSKSGLKKKKSKSSRKKSTCEPSLKIKLPVKQESFEDLTDKLEASVQSADSARPRDEQGPVQKVTQNRWPVSRDVFSGDINRKCGLQV